MPPETKTVPAPAAKTAPTPQTVQYIGFWRRFLAYMVDGIILMLVSIVFSVPMTFALRSGSSSNGVSALLGAAYFIGFWILWDGQTPGKKLLAIKIVRDNGQKMDFVTGLLRYIGYIVSAIVFYLGFIWVAFDKNKEGWHDKIAKTHVVATEGKPHTGIAILITVLGFVGFLAIMAVAATAILGALMIGNRAYEQAQMEKLKEGYSEEMLNQLEQQYQYGEEGALEDNQYTPEEQAEMQRQLEEQFNTMSEELDKYGVEFPTVPPAR